MSSALHSSYRGGVSRHGRGGSFGSPRRPCTFPVPKCASCLQALSVRTPVRELEGVGGLSPVLWHSLESTTVALRSGPPGASATFAPLLTAPAHILPLGSERCSAGEGVRGSRQTLSGTAVLSREYLSRSSEWALRGFCLCTALGLDSATCLPGAGVQLSTGAPES